MIDAEFTEKMEAILSCQWDGLFALLQLPTVPYRPEGTKWVRDREGGQRKGQRGTDHWWEGAEWMGRRREKQGIEIRKINSIQN